MNPTATIQRDNPNGALAKRAKQSLDSLFPSGIRRVLFVSPPDIHVDGFNYNTGKRRRYLNYPPYGLGLLARVAGQRGIETRIINLQTSVLRACLQSADEADFNFNTAWQEEISGESPDLIALTCMFSQTHKSLEAVSKYLKIQFPSIPQIAGGVHITNSLMQKETSQQFLDDLASIDLFMLYESDTSFGDFLSVVSGNLTPEHLSQLVIRGVGQFDRQAPPTGDDLNATPSWHLMHPAESAKWGKVGAFYFLRKKDPVTATVLANRGCRAQCTFCSVRNFNGVGVRRRNVESVVDELELLQNEHGVEHIMWLDDDFLYDRAETLKLFDLMVKRNIHISWDCSNGVIASSCTEDVLAGAVASGCIGLILGMESGNPTILREIKKPGNVDTFLRAAENLKKFEEIHSRVFLMIGFPNETLSQINDTFTVAREMDLDWYNIAPLQPLPNTPIYKSMVEQGLIQENRSFTDIKFNSGPYSRAAERAQSGRELLSLDFKRAFDDMSKVPSTMELDTIWAYLNFHLNYERLFSESRSTKLQMQSKYVEHICDAIAPDNAFAMYFLGLLTKKLGKKIPRSHIDRLEATLEQLPYWQERFRDFSLSVSHLKQETPSTNYERPV